MCTGQDLSLAWPGKLDSTKSIPKRPGSRGGIWYKQASKRPLDPIRSMELRRAGYILRWSQKPSHTFQTPAISSPCSSIVQRRLNSPCGRPLRRAFASSARSAVARSAQVTTSASPPTQAADSEISEKPSTSLDWLSGTGPSRAGHSSTPKSLTSNTESGRLMNKGDSASDILASLTAARTARFSRALNFDQTADPTTPNFTGSNYTDLRDLRKEFGRPPPIARTFMRLTPTTGRTVYVTPQIDVGRSFKLMEQLVGRNKIRSTFNSQRFHERPGLKRKRLKSVRWRKRFMLGFRAAVNRVKQLKKQGW